MPFLTRERRDRYWLLLAGAVVLFGVLTLLVSRTGDPLLTRALLVVGAFIGPVLYVVYLADSQLLSERPWRLVLTFLLGAALGLPLATFVEQRTLAGIGAFGPALVVGVIEELAKVAGLVWVLGRSRARFQMDGVVYGAAAGMGFAAFETLAYGVQRSEAVGALVGLLWLRALLSPFSHGTWTAIIGAALWRGRVGGSPRLDRGVAIAFATSVALHALWDWQPLSGAAGMLWLVAVGIGGVLVLRAVVHRATREEASSALALNPELAGAAVALPRVNCAVCGQRSLPGSHYCVRCGSALRA
jgi:RsiW-degrading membrane proteinase PrsW (M82 family)